MSVRISLTDLLLSPVAHREKKLWICWVFTPPPLPPFFSNLARLLGRPDFHSESSFIHFANP